MSDLIDKAMQVASGPATDTWRDISNQVLRSRGRAAYDAPLVPGFDFTAEDVLLLPSEKEYDAQVARGEEPGYVQENTALETRKDIQRTKNIISRLAKLGYDTQESPDGSREPYYVTDTNTFDRDYSAERDRHIQQGINIAWSGNAGADRASETAEPSILNQSLRGGPQ